MWYLIHENKKRSRKILYFLLLFLNPNEKEGMRLYPLILFWKLIDTYYGLSFLKEQHAFSEGEKGISVFNSGIFLTEIPN